MESGARNSEATLSTPRDGPGHSNFEIGACVWSPCARLGFRRSTIVSVDAHRDSFFVASSDNDPSQGGQTSVRRSDVRPCYDIGPHRTFQDNTEMVHLDDANILDNLRRRYMKDLIYTYTANVLLAVNPYKPLPGLYTKETMDMYRGKNQGTLPPHPYAIADVAYRQLARDRKNQALVISGESGAGKTETAKKTMHYLTGISRTDAAQGSRIQDKIVNANPILESFGNATTVMNTNSSRFGKYNEMMFNRVGSLIGAGIKTFLLESSRVVSQQPGEKNYHVFYELLAGMDEETTDRLMLFSTVQHYKLLHSGGGKPLEKGSQEAQKLAAKFEELKAALSTFADQEVQDSIWDVVGALVHLGEVDFVETAPAAPAEEASTVPGPDQGPRVEVAPDSTFSLEQAAELLGLPYVGIEKVLLEKEMRVKTTFGRISYVKCPRTLQQARQTLQCIIKIFYKRLFDKIVALINNVSNSSAKEQTQESNYNSIGTLDIYGFERLQTNGFEQLCINLANERLQQFFVEEVLQAEQRMYAEERLNIQSMELPDSKPVVSGIQSIMTVLDEHSLRAIKNLCRIGPGDDKDMKFCENVHRELIKDPRQEGPIMALKLKGSRSGNGPGLHDGFQIRHYAGCVPYSTKGWIDKNNDSLVPEIEALLGDGTKSLVRDMADAQGITAASGERLHSVSQNYLTNLNDLLATLQKCSVHYIRCFNPNQNRQAGVFDAKYVLDQVIQCGTVELVKIMHHGYPHRCFLKDLRERFSSLLPPEFGQYTDRDFLHAVMIAWEIDESQWTLGTKRLFLKAGQLRVLEDLKDEGCQASQEVIRRIRRQFRMKKLRAFAYAVDTIQYLKMCVKRSNGKRVFTAFVKAMNTYVRIHRWLGRVRTRLYGLQESVERSDVARDLEYAKLGWAFTPLCPEGPDTQFCTDCRLFVTPNSAEAPTSALKLQHQVDVSYPVQKSLEKAVHRNASESVLYFDGRVLKCMKMNGKAFDRPHDHDGEETSFGRALEDARQVDVFSTGEAQALHAVRPTDQHIVAICQHPDNSQVFATCTNANEILIWQWLGTRTGALEEPAVKVECFFTPKRKKRFTDSVMQVCFLPKVAHPGHAGRYVLLVLMHVPGRDWLQITAYTVGIGAARFECGTQVYLTDNEITAEYTRKYPVRISHFGVSSSGAALIVAGEKLLQMFSISSENDRLRLSPMNTGRALDDILTKDAGYHGGGSVSSVCTLLSCTPGYTDWIALGMSSGEMYGVPLKIGQDGLARVDSNNFGRYKQQKQAHGVRICSVVPTYEPTAGALQQVSHSSRATKAAVNPWMTISVGGDGNLTTWHFDELKWVPEESEQNVCQGQAQQGGIVAAQSSALVPSVLLVADEQNRCIVALNRANPNQQFRCSME
mmetsp:Transcript_101254/g.179895  ORF Transcript_101254/g.179895 Transcript_101254/m.179895 type:complete len:1387 (+) Transcript_101254:70-4230(+)